MLGRDLIIGNPDHPSLAVSDADLFAAVAAFRTQGRSGTFQAARYRLRYIVWGEGPPLVFVHGMADHARSFLMVMRRLVDRRTCIAYELADGLTDGSRLAAYNHDDYVSDLIELLDRLGHSKADVLGSSFGTTIVLAALARWPDRFAHGILQGGFAHRPLSTPQRLLCRLGKHLPGWLGDWPTLYHPGMNFAVQPTLSVLPPAVKHYLFARGGETPIRAAALRSIMIDQLDLRALLPCIRTPVLMIGGDRDAMVPLECEREIEEGLPNVHRVEIAGCGHYPHFSHPAVMADAVREFLA